MLERYQIKGWGVQGRAMDEGRGEIAGERASAAAAALCGAVSLLSSGAELQRAIDNHTTVLDTVGRPCMCVCVCVCVCVTLPSCCRFTCRISSEQSGRSVEALSV